MPDEPYRPEPSNGQGSAEVERLAAEGRHRLMQATARRASVARDVLDKKQEKNLRVALGGHYGSPLRLACVLSMVAGVALMAADFFSTADTLAPGILLFLGGFLVRMFAPPTASRRRVASERQWVASLPFVLEGYFEVLSAPPEPHCCLRTTLAWADAGLVPSDVTVQGVLGVLDTDARVESSGEGTLTMRTGPIAGNTGIIVNGGYAYRNTRLVGYVHRLVGEVLLPLHRAHAIARVNLSR